MFLNSQMGCEVLLDNVPFIVILTALSSINGLDVLISHLDLGAIWDVTYSDHCKYTHETNHLYLDSLIQLVSQKK